MKKNKAVWKQKKPVCHFEHSDQRRPCFEQDIKK